VLGSYQGFGLGFVSRSDKVINDTTCHCYCHTNSPTGLLVIAINLVVFVSGCRPRMWMIAQIQCILLW
jgi:hypothetical protein